MIWKRKQARKELRVLEVDLEDLEGLALVAPVHLRRPKRPTHLEAHFLEVVHLKLRLHLLVDNSLDQPRSVCLWLSLNPHRSKQEAVPSEVDLVPLDSHRATSSVPVMPESPLEVNHNLLQVALGNLHSLDLGNRPLAVLLGLLDRPDKWVSALRALEAHLFQAFRLHPKAEGLQMLQLVEDLGVLPLVVDLQVSQQVVVLLAWDQVCKFHNVFA